MIPINTSIIEQSIDFYGKDIQSIICMEECSELIQAVSKELRGKTDIEHLAEEIADVLISIELLKQIYNVSQSTIYDWINYKQTRMLERIKYERFNHMSDYEKGVKNGETNRKKSIMDR